MTTTELLKREARNFWGEVYRTAYSAADRKLTRNSLGVGLDALEDMFRYRAHLAVTEMPIAELGGKSVLEIGSGAGAHSALFARQGAKVTAIELTFERARATQAKFDLLGVANCGALQADAERLPFANASFDIVYSNGVLHHTPDTVAAIAELRRVLKPGGRAVVMLYCKSSLHYWLTLWFCVGLLQGRMFRSPRWLGEATEWIGETPQHALNPMTRCYTRREIERLFAEFDRVTLRKSEFSVRLIPKLGRLYRRIWGRRLGDHPGGSLVYGTPWPVSAKWEIGLGRWIGWAWNISAVKRVS